MIDRLLSTSRPGALLRSPRAGALLLGASLLLLVPGCELFRQDGSSLSGAGPRAMQPYEGRKSGALRLGLQLYNGCGVMGDGSTTGPGSMAADAGTGFFTYPYPATCSTLHGATRPATASKPMSVAVGVPYFLDQFTVADVAQNLHTNTQDQREALTWMRTQTRFKNLDWSGVGVVADDWDGDRAAIGGFVRTVRYGGAAWMKHLDDAFLVEILDRDGNVVASQDYKRSSFALENPIGGHTQFLWSYGVVGKPEFLGDTRQNPVPTQPLGGASVRPASFRTLARLDVQAQTAPHESTLVIPRELAGQDGVARVTWTKLPNEPFYFPLSFTDFPTEEAPVPAFPQCWTEAGDQVPCDFGIDPQVTFTAPANGLGYYEPGETFQAIVRFKDSLGNLLHPPDSLPSFNDFLAGRSNGLLYQYSNHNGIFGERAVWSSMSVQGPIQKMKPFYGRESEYGWFSQWGRGFIPSTAANNNLLAGARDVRPDTRWPIALPPDAEPGTYVMLLKGNRQFLGERMARTGAFYFQVGQKEKTAFPQRVGNCDICHMGPTSLANVSMGMDTGAVEACKACHGSTTTRFLHQVHMLSEHYPAKKNDCTVCHLTYEGAIRTSLITCTSCHMQAHAAQYFEQSFTAVTTSSEPNLQSQCATSCHESTVPTAHIIPPRRGKEH